MMNDRQCKACGTTCEKPMRCSRCKEAFYCSQECQKEDWNAHKPFCQNYRKSHTTDSTRANIVDLSWIREGCVDDSVIQAISERAERMKDWDGDIDNEYYYSEDDQNSNVLLLRRYAFLSESSKVGEAAIVALKSLLIDDLVAGPTNKMMAMWDSGNITQHQQQSMNACVKIAKDKAEFVLVGIILEAIRATGWQQFRPQLVSLCLGILQEVVKLASKAPHPGPASHGNLPAVMKHFQIRKFLQGISLLTWNEVLYYSKVSVDPDEFIPILRQLAMLDCVDAQWNSLGSWNNILDELGSTNCGGGIARTKNDEHLERISAKLRSACNSMQCKILDTDPRYHFEGLDAPQKWRYQAVATSKRWTIHTSCAAGNAGTFIGAATCAEFIAVTYHNTMTPCAHKRHLTRQHRYELRWRLCLAWVVTALLRQLSNSAMHVEKAKT